MTSIDAHPASSAVDVRGGSLAGRTALVTGGARGIGAAICQSLASQGASVAAGFSGNTERAEQFADDLKSLLPGAAPVTLHQGNVGNAADCNRVVEEVIEAHGRLDILVNNAGITVDKLVLKLDDDDWDKVIAVNLSGAFRMARSALAHMTERGSGRIINVSSFIGEVGNIGQVNYAASKSGLFGFTKALAREAAFILERSGQLTDDGVGITVNSVSPGVIRTDMTAQIPDKLMERVLASIPLKRLGRPEEVARVVHFLASDASSYITGQVWAVNGGVDM